MSDNPTSSIFQEYNIHKERDDWTRFARGQSETFQTLEGLVSPDWKRNCHFIFLMYHLQVDKGVKVDIGIPHELWKKPSAEVTNLKTQCESLMEEHEEDIEDWYFKHQVRRQNMNRTRRKIKNYIIFRAKLAWRITSAGKGH